MYYNEYSNKQQIKKLTVQLNNPTFQKKSKISVMKRNHCRNMVVYFIKKKKKTYLNNDYNTAKSIKELLIRPIKKNLK